MTHDEAVQLVQEFVNVSKVDLSKSNLDIEGMARVVVKEPAVEDMLRKSLRHHAQLALAKAGAQRLEDSRPEFDRAMNQSIGRMRTLA